MELTNGFNGEVYSLPVYEKEENGRMLHIIRHETLQFLINTLMYRDGNIAIDYDNIPAQEGYIVKCTIRNKAGFKVTEFGEASNKNLMTQVGQMYPFLIAKQRAHDRAVIAFLGLRSKVYSDKEICLDGSETELRAQDLASSEPAKKGLTPEEVEELNRLAATNVQCGNKLVPLGSLDRDILKYAASAEELDENFRSMVARYIELADAA